MKNQNKFNSLPLSPSVDKVGVEERVSRFQKRSIKANSKMDGLKMVLNMIDLTTLEGKDTPGKVRQMCYKAIHLHDSFPGLPTVAAVCVYPSMVGLAKSLVKGSNVKVASVEEFDDSEKREKEKEQIKRTQVRVRVVAAVRELLVVLVQVGR